MEKFKSLIKIVNDHLSLIIAVPAVLGGLWQLISLIAIDPSYIRFFSVTQLLADGLLITVFSTCLLLISWIMYLLSKLLKKDKIEDSVLTTDELPKPLNKFDQYLGSILLWIFCAGTSWFFYEISTSFKLPSHILLQVIIYVFAIFIVLLIFIAFISAFAIHSIKKQTVDGPIGYIAGIGTVLIISLGLFYILFQFDKSSMLSKNLINAENVLLNAQNENKNYKYQIRYFNDTYIFLSVSKGSSSKIKVLKFDAFFEENNKVIK